MAAAVFLAYAAKPFALASSSSSTMEGKMQHLASILGGISMGVAAFTCVCMGGYRIMEALEERKQEK